MIGEKEYLMWLAMLRNIAHHKRDVLLHKFGSAEELFKTPRKIFEQINGLSDKNIDELCENRDPEKLKKYADRVYNSGVEYIIKGDGIYPEILREVYDAPFGLYLKGDKSVLKEKTVSMVGTRKATPYGMAAAEKIAGDFAEKGVVVVSGMADGIDSASHRGALKAGGKTIAVLGCGVNVCYPKTNEFLMKRIEENGCVLSEYPLDEKANGRYFPERNRIIAGLSMAVVVVEAMERGGSLITANLAVDFGREVFAVPGSINSAASKGTNALIKSGASLMTEASDAFFAVGINPDEEKNLTKEKICLENSEKLVYDCINSGDASLEEIILKTGLDISEVQLILLSLEMNGLIAKLPGAKYQLI
ncbi:MAG: DNA-processing protein DprA [Clostridiales bacterium]|nr:DNA-processing protein DprA [Clostridiales bacterium]